MLYSAEFCPPSIDLGTTGINFSTILKINAAIIKFITHHGYVSVLGTGDADKAGEANQSKHSKQASMTFPFYFFIKTCYSCVFELIQACCIMSVDYLKSHKLQGLTLDEPSSLNPIAFLYYCLSQKKKKKKNRSTIKKQKSSNKKKSKRLIILMAIEFSNLHPIFVLNFLTF